MGPLLLSVALCLSAAVPQRVKAADGEDPTSADQKREPGKQHKK